MSAHACACLLAALLAAFILFPVTTQAQTAWHVDDSAPGNPDPGVAQGISHDCVEPPPGLVGWWSADGNAEDIARCNSGTILGGMGFDQGMVAQAFLFDDVDDGVQIPNTNGVYDLVDEWTVDAWVFPFSPGWDQRNDPIVWKTSSGGNRDTFFLAWGASAYPGDSDRFVTGLERASDGTDFGAFSEVHSAGAWYHVTGVYDGTSLIIFVNGFEEGRSEIGSVIAYTSPDPLMIGNILESNHGYAGVFDGLIDEVEVFDRALSAEEIEAIYLAGSAGKCKTFEDCNENGVPDECDIADGTSGDLNGNGVPDECEGAIYVDDDAPNDPCPGDPNCSDPLENGSLEHPFDAIQEGIDAASNGDEVVACPGTYNEAIDLLGKAIWLHSSNGPEVTIIDATGLSASVVTCASGEGPDTILAGFTITGGVGTRRGFEHCSGLIGGGMLNENGSSPTVTDCTFTGNSACCLEEGRGGGMCNAGNSNPIVTDCTFSNNVAVSFGGGMANYANSSPTVTDCMFSGNWVDYYGGGMSNLEGNPTVVRCMFRENGAGLGGGMYNDLSEPIVSACTFTSNGAESGGGMWSYRSSPTVVDCTFVGNVVSYYWSWNHGGGMASRSSEPTVANCTFYGNQAPRGGAVYYRESSPTLTNCTITGNTAGSNGGGVCCGDRASSPTLANCTFSGNSAPNGAAVACDSWDQQYPSTVVLANCILWDGGGEVWNNDDSTITITHSDVCDGWEGIGNIDADPLFIDPNSGDYRLSPDSPCIDAADDDAVPPDTLDLDGDGDTTEPIPIDLDGRLRFADRIGTSDTGSPDPNYPNLPIVDMGAYEYQCDGDLDGDGDIDASDLAQLLVNYGTTSGATYEDGNLDEDDDVDLSDLAALLAVYGTTCP